MKNVLVKIKLKILHFWKKFLVVLYYPEFKNIPFKTRSDEEHLKATMKWLCLAQDVTGCNGVSASYDIAIKKWGQAYRETTGYIIETFVDYYKLTGNKEYLDRAKKMADWEIKVMSPEGAVGEIHDNGILYNKVFNTGQVMLGFYKLFVETKDEKYRQTLKKSAEWLVLNQEQTGEWNNFSTKGPKTIDTRVAWALFEVYSITGDERYKISAEKNLEWTLKQQKENFWFDTTSFTKRNAPWTHMIAYTISGLIEIYKLGLNDKKIYDSFYGAAKASLYVFNTQKTSAGFMPGTFDENWESSDDYSCLTGDCQLATIWMEVYEYTHEKPFLDAAIKILDQVKSTQIMEKSHREIKGGIFGSYPIYGDYAPFLLINWAAKFFADALMLKVKINKQI